MKLKKVLFVLHYPPPKHGSAMVGQYIRESELVNTTFECRYINLGTSISVAEIGKGGALKYIRYFKIVWSTIRSLILFRPNLVYFTLTSSGSGFYKDAMIVLIAKLFGKKIVYHFHNKGVSIRQDKWLDNVLYKIAFKNAEVILLSKHLYKDVMKYVSRDKVHYCANGIPENQILKSKRTTNKNKVQILFLSNLLESKGVFVLLESCALLQARRIPFECIFIGAEGDIAMQRFHEKIDFLGIKNCVHYAGKKYGKEKELAYSAADIFVFPTYFETFGLVNLEAMQYSLPIVSTLEGGIPDVVTDGETGFLVQSKDAEALAKKLEILINDPELRLQMGEKGRIRYEKEFTLKIFETRFCGILKKLT